MASRGVMFALTQDEEERLLKASNDAEVMEVIESVEEAWDREWLCQLDKAWDAIHRSLTDGELHYENGEYPLNHAIIGGRLLYEGDDYVVAYVSAEQVKDVAKALQSFDNAKLRDGYGKINRANYQYAGWEDDYEYTEGWFASLGPFYQKAAEADRAVVFTVDL